MHGYVCTDPVHNRTIRMTCVSVETSIVEPVSSKGTRWHVRQLKTQNSLRNRLL